MRFLFVTLMVVAALSSLISCKSVRSDSNSKAIIGTDDLISAERSPFAELVGQIKSKTGTCTFFVSGTNTITTAAHCLDLNIKDKMLFELNGLPIDVLTTEFRSEGNDVAVLNTKTKFSKFLSNSALNQSRPVSIVGFSNRFEQQLNCTTETTKESNTFVFHNCDTRSGMSGSPILQNDHVVAVHVGYYESLNRNVALQATFIGKEENPFPFENYIKEGSVCGSDSTALGEAYSTLTTDWWPDSGTISVLSAYFATSPKTILDAGCAAMGQAYFGEACRWHDDCYDGYLLPGVDNRISCDQGLKNRWVDSCMRKYRKRGSIDLNEPAKSVCRNYCRKFAEGMYEVQSRIMANDANGAWAGSEAIRAKNAECVRNAGRPIKINGVPGCDGAYDLTGTFMITSRSDPRLSFNAVGGAVQLAALYLRSDCTNSNPDCLWRLKDGMLVSARNPSLAINAYQGARQLGLLRLHSACTPSNPDCTWMFDEGVIKSAKNQTLLINAYQGARHMAPLMLNKDCIDTNPDCLFDIVPR